MTTDCFDIIDGNEHDRRLIRRIGSCSLLNVIPLCPRDERVRRIFSRKNLG